LDSLLELGNKIQCQIRIPNSMAGGWRSLRSCRNLLKESMDLSISAPYLFNGNYTSWRKTAM